VADHELGRLLEALDDDYTVIMFSDSNEFTPYQPKFSSPVVDANLKQKRWSAEPEKIVPVNRKAKFTADKRSLFEKYQFFTPGMLPHIFLPANGPFPNVSCRSIHGTDHIIYPSIYPWSGT
jgi:hypothetical protein